LRESQPTEAQIKTKKERRKAPSTQQQSVSTKAVPTDSKKAVEEKTEGPTEEPVDISLEEALQKIVERYNNPDVAKKFSSWNETLMMEFPDIEKSYLYKINRDEGIELEEGYDEDAAVQVKLSSDIFIKMMTNQINPIKAYSSGELEVSGKMRNLLKLRKLMF
jgi:putative sterol carrier protein